MNRNHLSIQDAKGLDMVAYLESLGYGPQKIRGNDYWYLSPLREEKTPSFKVDRKLNLWYDHGIGKGGNLVDFGVLFYHCSVAAFLRKLTDQSALNFSFHPLISASKEETIDEEKGLRILAVKPLDDTRLCNYLMSRKIPLSIATEYVKEVAFEMRGKHYTAIGFQNNSGGYELRNSFFKGCVAPKDSTVILKEGGAGVVVFEGFFSFLSYLTLAQKEEAKSSLQMNCQQSNYLVLNSLSFLEKSRPLMEEHSCIHLFLDRDGAGIKATKEALHWSAKYRDGSSRYSQHKDLNDYLLQSKQIVQKQSGARGRHL